jgi:hypothetical protein
MSSPFRLNKKERRQYRKRAVLWSARTDRYEEAGERSDYVEFLRSSAAWNRMMSFKKRRKRSP